MRGDSLRRPPGRPVTARARVLIVDDSVELVASLRAVLLAGEWSDGSAAADAIEVVTASCGEEGLAIAHARGFDVAIVDVKLPDTSGVDLIFRLRSACPFGEVILITGFATMDAAIGALRSGAFAFVPKSFRPEELVSTVEQAHAKVRLAREREELERRYRALVDLTDVLVVGLDSEDCIALFNRKAATLVGVEPSAAVGRPFVESWIPDEDRIRMRETIALARAGRPQEIETGFVDSAPPGTLPGGGAPVWHRDRPESTGRSRVRWHLSMARAGGDEPAVVYGFGIDVTERRALEKRAADAEALSAMGRLAMNLAHEIRNPLNAAVLQLHLLGRHVDKLPVDDDSRAALRSKTQIVGDEIGRLSRLLTEFLDLARPRAGVRELVHLGHLVDGVLDLEQGAAAARGVIIERDLSNECVLVGDAEKLKQVILNLVMNSLEAMKDGGVLRVDVDYDGDRVRLMVEDTGTGIEPSALAQVFDPFFTTKEAGTGLGLSIVRKIVEQHGGEVGVESERGVGTRAIVLLPRGR
ncbi:MAG TPA: ATP-binding protein [Polyangiaceae bacterium]|nr:ATP-binding protein [Polyangiaceae bacterium]